MRALYTLLPIVLFASASCRFSMHRVEGNGNVVTQNRNISNAKKIRVLGSMDVILQAGETAVKVESEENLLPYIITKMSDGWLEISRKNNVSITSHDPMKVYITTPYVNDLVVAGSGNVTSDAKFKNDEPVSIKIGGSGDVSIEVNSPKVEADIAGSGNLKISGETKDVSVAIGGSGNYRGGELKAENANVKIVGSGDAEVFADVQLDAKVVGSGSVSYRGNANVEKKIIGSGSVRKL